MKGSITRPLNSPVKSDVPLTGKESNLSIKEGWLTKQGNYIKNWRPRWFQLRRDGILIYYKEPTVEVKPTNFFVLVGSKIRPYEKFGPGCFEIIMANGEKRYMQANARVERDEWIECLTAAANRKRGPNLIGQPQLLPGNGPNTDAYKSLLPQQRNATIPGLSNVRLIPESFTFHKVLGKGNYGKVMLASLKEGGDGRYFAIKAIKKSSLIDDESLEHVLAENRVLQTLNHPNLVRLYSSFQTADRLYFVMEYVNGGELFYHIGKEKRFTEDRVRFYAAQILVALQYLHQKEIVYRDLKLENLLIDQDGYIKITDFGLCKEGIGTDDTTSTFCGTPEYLAPEILEEENYGKSVDWWALGVVMYEMLLGRPPFGPANNMEKLFYNILHQPIQFGNSLSERSLSILQRLLERDFTKRIGCTPTDGEEIMQHPFFVCVEWDKLARREIPAPFKPVITNADDVANFDKEFTQLPAELTPPNSAEYLRDGQRTVVGGGGSKDAALQLQNFTFVNESALRSHLE